MGPIAAQLQRVYYWARYHNTLTGDTICALGWAINHTTTDMDDLRAVAANMRKL